MGKQLHQPRLQSNPTHQQSERPFPLAPDHDPGRRQRPDQRAEHKRRGVRGQVALEAAQRGGGALLVERHFGQRQRPDDAGVVAPSCRWLVGGR
jgi:hypothetical protein